MAIYHFSAQVISRSQGRSSVAASAYRSAQRLLDERTGLTHDYTHKSDVVDQAILLPDNAPEALANRETLWNTVEHTERRKDAQLAREINIALPRELSSEQNWALLKDFVQTEFVAKGMVADVAFHRGHTGSEDQPHGHVMLTMREITPAGFGAKVRAWNDKALLTTWRERWAERCNLELARADLDIRIDHRTLEAQGINLEPQTKIGPAEAKARLARQAEHDALAQRNGERLRKEPTLALGALTRQQSTFTHHDIARFVNRHTVDTAQFEQVMATITTHPDVVLVGHDARGQARYSTRELVALESELVARVLSRAECHDHRLLETATAAVAAKKGLTDEQHQALNHITQGTDVACVVGFAGTGKSYLLGAAREAWEAQGYRVHGMTLSGIAAENLEASSGIASRTVASRLWYWERDRERLSAHDIVVVDEAGMLGSRQLARVVSEVHHAGAKLVLVGDPEQLQAIEAGAAYRAIAERVGFMEMTDIRRQRVPWQQQATRDLATAHTAQALAAYDEHHHLHRFDTQSDAMTEMVSRWDALCRGSPETTQILLAYTREEVRLLNTLARERRDERGELGPDVTVTTARGQRVLAENDRIYFLRNERSLGVKNGTLGTVECIDGERLTVRLDKPDQDLAQHVSFALTEYNDIDHGYAATVYKAQGVTVDHSHVLTSPYFDRHTTYVALSRHRNAADVYVSRESFPRAQDLAQCLGRERRKDITVDYGIETGGAPSRHRSAEQAFADDLKSGLRPPSVEREVHTVTERAPLSRGLDDELAAFKAQFEQTRGVGEVQRLKQETIPLVGDEKRAAEVARQLQALEQRIAAGEKAYGARREWSTLAKQTAQSAEVMKYLAQHDKALSERIRAHQKQLERGKGRDYGGISL